MTYRIIRRTRREGQDSGLLLLVGCVVMTAVLFSAGKVFGSSGLTLSFRDSVMVNDTVIRLQDVCTIGTRPNDVSASQINAMVIGEAAPAGFSRFIGTDDITKNIERTYGVPVVMQKEMRICVSTLGVRHQVTEFKNAIDSFVVESLNLPASDVVVRLADTAASFQCLDKKFAVQIEKNLTPVTAGNNALKLTIRQGSVSRSITVMCRVSVVAGVVVAIQDIPRGSALSTDNCRIVRKTLNNYNLSPCRTLETALGNRTRMAIRQGMVVCAQHIEKIPVVSKGQQVSLIGSNGRIRIAVTCIARESGSVGEMVWVENESSRKLIRGIVIGPGQVGTTPTQRVQS